MDVHKSYDIVEFDGRRFAGSQTRLIVETTLLIFVNGAELVRLRFSGMFPRYLAAGHLLARGLIRSAQDLESLQVTEADGSFEARAVLRESLGWAPGQGVTLGLGHEPVTSEWQGKSPLPFVPGSIRPEDVIRLGTELHARSHLYRQTRGCHNSSLCTSGEMLLFRCDIGRHNAIDTLVGHCLLDGIVASDKMIVTTGRVAREIVDKALHAGIPVLASSSAATSLAVDEARRRGLTLIGNLSESGFRVYNDTGRLAGWGNA